MFLCKEDNHVYNWLTKLKENQVNSDVLLLIFEGDFRNYENKDIKLNEIKDRIIKELATQKFSNYEILTIENIASVKVDTNTILIGYERMDRKFLQDIDFQILFCYCKNDNEETILPIVTKEIALDEYTNKPFYIIKKINQVEIICSYRLHKIENYLDSYFRQNVFLSSSQKRIIMFYPSVLEYWVDSDIKILYLEKVLTARLAKAIYKVSTLNFNVSNRKVGLFYKTVFGIKSKSKRLKMYENRVFKVYCIGEWLKSKC